MLISALFLATLALPSQPRYTFTPIVGMQELITLNDKDEVVGQSMIKTGGAGPYSTFTYKSYVWASGKMTEVQWGQTQCLIDGKWDILNPVDYADISLLPLDMNEKGDICGFVSLRKLGEVSCLPESAGIYHRGKLYVIESIKGFESPDPTRQNQSRLGSVNNSGVSVGFLSLTDKSKELPIRFDLRSMKVSPVWTDKIRACSLAINDAGLMAGYSFYDSASFTIKDGKLQEFKDPERRKQITTINNVGTILWSGVSSGFPEQLRSGVGSPEPLGRLASAQRAEAFCMNDRGQSIGLSYTPQGIRLTLWNGTKPTDLTPELPGISDDSSLHVFSLGLNNRGTILIAYSDMKQPKTGWMGLLRPVQR